MVALQESTNVMFEGTQFVPEEVLFNVDKWEYRYIHSDVQRKHVHDQLRRRWGRYVTSAVGPDYYAFQREMECLERILVDDVGHAIRDMGRRLSEADRMTALRGWLKVIKRIMATIFLVVAKHVPESEGGGLKAMRAIEARRNNVGFDDDLQLDMKVLSDRAKARGSWERASAPNVQGGRHAQGGS